MHLAIEAMGADAGCFVGIIPEPGSAPSIRCLFDFDVATWYEQLRQPCGLNDPWLTYARLNAEPIVIADDARFGGMALGSSSEGMFEPAMRACLVCWDERWRPK